MVVAGWKLLLIVVEDYMLLNFTSDESLKNMDTAVKENMKDMVLEYK